MKFFVAAVLAAGLMLAVGGPHRSGAQDSLTAAVGEVLERQQSAWNRGDLEGFMAGYWRSPDLVFTSGGTVRRGFDTLLERYRTTYGSGASMGRLDFSQLEVHPLGPEAAWALGRWSLARGEERLGGVFTLVLRRLDGGWRIVHDHTSSNSAP